ncbi:MAG: hypothetical protein ABIL09_15540 [Gemmatimonadota bacterium]
MSSVGGVGSGAGPQVLGKLQQRPLQEEQTESPQEKAREARQGEEGGQTRSLQLDLRRGVGSAINLLA